MTMMGTGTFSPTPQAGVESSATHDSRHFRCREAGAKMRETSRGGKRRDVWTNLTYRPCCSYCVTAPVHMVNEHDRRGAGLVR